MRLERIGPILFALVIAPAGLAQIPNCAPSAAAKQTPRLPFQVTFEKQVTKANFYTDILLVPFDRFAVIENVAIKGTQAANSYLAIELATSLGVGYPMPLPAITPATQVTPAFRINPLVGYARHFLYANQTSVTAPVHVREETKILAGSNTRVALGIQSSPPNVQPFSITLTGTYVERCSLAP